jgi:hypothetical protein
MPRLLLQKTAMITQDSLGKPHNRTAIPNVLPPVPFVHERLLKRRELARAISVSPRTVDNLQRQKKIPFVRISPRCVRFHLPSVLAALRKFEVQEAGRRR